VEKGGKVPKVEDPDKDRQLRLKGNQNCGLAGGSPERTRGETATGKENQPGGSGEVPAAVTDNYGT